MAEIRSTRRSFVGLAAAACGAAIAPYNAGASATGRLSGADEASSLFEIVRPPDLLIAYAGLKTRRPLELAGDRWGNRNIVVQTKVVHAPSAAELEVHLSSPQTALTHLHLRWKAKVSPGLRMLGDAWERSYGDLEWRGIVPDRPMPWYFLTFDGKRLNGYGVRTGAGALCFWQVDPGGVSLWLDVRNGGNAVELGARELHAATIVSRAGQAGETPNESAQQFCKGMCRDPRLPDGPIYGSNDWNYAYGKNTADGIVRDADLVASLAQGNRYKPTVVIDDGWQDKARFPDMAGLASSIRKRKLRPGLWIRPTRAPKEAKASLLLSAARFGKNADAPDLTYDPTIPEALEAMLTSVREPVAWGYEFIKHDFSTYELFGGWGFAMGLRPTHEGWSFSNRSRTNAEIVLDFYQALRQAAGEKTMLLGCNTIGHLGAGIFESQRTGDDTSGVLWERTRRMGVNTLAFRAAQHRTFFHLDPDCVAITGGIPWKDTQQWLHVVSRTGTSLFVSPQHEAMGLEQKAAMKEAFAIVASSSGWAEDWLDNTTPQRWRFKGGREPEHSYDWNGEEGSLAFDV